MSKLSNRITIIGSINLDHVLRLSRLPVAGETLPLADTRDAPGGKGANQAVAAGKNGGDVTFIGATGADVAGVTVRSAMQAAGVDLRHVAKITGVATGQAYILLQESGENSILIDHGANALVSPRRIESAAAAIQFADIVLAQCEVPLASVRAAFNLAKAADKLTILNPAPAPKALAPSLLALVDIIVPNETESSTLTGITITDQASMAESAAWFHERGVATVIITLGARGAYLSTATHQELVPAFGVSAVDTTAAGDTFIGALAAQLGDVTALHDAVVYASMASALAVQHTGAMPSIPDAEAVTAALAKSNR